MPASGLARCGACRRRWAMAVQGEEAGRWCLSAWGVWREGHHRNAGRGVRSRDSADSRQGHRVTLRQGLPVLLLEQWRTTQRPDQRIQGLMEQKWVGWEPELPE